MKKKQLKQVKLQLKMQNNHHSIKYFKKAIESLNKKNEFSLKSKIELVVIYHEMKDFTQSENYLKELLKTLIFMINLF